MTAKTIHWVPTVTLEAGSRHDVYLGKVSDISGNHYHGEHTSFYTSENSEEDTLAPTVLNTSINDGLIDIATNSRIRVQFSEAVDELSFENVSVSAAGIAQSIGYSLDSDKTILTLTPSTLLPVNTKVTVVIKGVKDKAGNVQAVDNALTIYYWYRN